MTQGHPLHSARPFLIRLVGAALFVVCQDYPPHLPGTPTQYAPLKGASGEQASAVLSWSAVAGATGYQIQLALDSGFNAMVLDSARLSSTSVTISGLSNATPRYWRVRAETFILSGGWSTVERLTSSAGPASALGANASD